jgi:hypothetical protein
MEVSDELQCTAGLPLRKQPLVLSGQSVGWYRTHMDVAVKAKNLSLTRN